MEINKALSVINAKCGDFSSLPKEMTEIVNKAELETYLIKTEEIEKEVVTTFLNLIYDEVIYLLLPIYMNNRTRKIRIIFHISISLKSILIY